MYDTPILSTFQNAKHWNPTRPSCQSSHANSSRSSSRDSANKQRPPTGDQSVALFLVLLLHSQAPEDDKEVKQEVATSLAAPEALCAWMHPSATVVFFMTSFLFMFFSAALTTVELL